MSRRHSTQEGFTLVETLVVVPITVLLVGAAAAALIIGFRTTEGTRVRLAESQDAQLLQLYLNDELLSAQTINTDAVPSPPTYCNSPPAEMSQGTNVMRLQWSDAFSDESIRFEASYRLSNSHDKLVRIRCCQRLPANTTTTATVPASDCPNGAANVKTVIRGIHPSIRPVVNITGQTISLKITEGSCFAYSVAGDRRTPATATSATTTTTVACSSVT